MTAFVSSCLLGNKCRYNGISAKNDKVITFTSSMKVVPICPEVEAGLSVPRYPIELDENRCAINKSGEDFTFLINEGCRGIASMMEKEKHCIAILKNKSPTCGKGKIYDGTFSGRIIDGNGILAQILINQGFTVMSDDEICKNE